MKDYNWEAQHKKELMDTVSAFNPTVIVGAFCFSNHQDGDVKMHLAGRSHAQLRSRASNKAELEKILKIVLEEMYKLELEIINN